MKHQIKTLSFDSQAFLFRDDGWISATDVAAKFGKSPSDWLRQRETVEYIGAMARHLGQANSDFLEQLSKIKEIGGASAASQAKILRLVKQTKLVSTKTGSAENGGGTWLHPKLAVTFARWLDADFAVWCDLQIDGLIRTFADWSKVRLATANGTAMMGLVLKNVRASKGKDTSQRHYTNEAKLVNIAFNGSSAPVDRDLLSDDEMQFMADIIQFNIALIAQGLEYEQRKPLLLDFADMKRPQPPAVEFDDDEVIDTRLAA